MANRIIDGKITYWNDVKGFGLITSYAGGNPIFFHVQYLTLCGRRPEFNQLISYTLSVDRQGRPCAVEVEIKEGRHSLNTKSYGFYVSVIISITFLATVCFFVISTKVPPFILAVYSIASLFTYFMYALDKTAAKQGARRTRESTLHFLSLIGGWPGALVAQQWLRHKSKKKPFRVVFWATVFLNAGAFLLFTPEGEVFLKALIANVMSMETNPFRLR